MIQKALNRLLSENNMSGYQLSKLTGIGEVQISRYRKGETTPRQKALKIIAEAFGVEVSELFK